MLELPEDTGTIKEEFENMAYLLGERLISLWHSVKAIPYNGTYGGSGVTAVHKATHVSRPTIHPGIKETQSEEKLEKVVSGNQGEDVKKLRRSSSHPDGSGQFEHINETVRLSISVGEKKKSKPQEK